MKRVLFLILSVIFFAASSFGQKVDSIKVEQAGEFIKIHYKIINSNPGQFFRVTVLCSINGGLKSELKSLVGDFGDNVVGGKPGYTVLWDVLKDVEEVNSVDFSVRAELTKDDSPVRKEKENKNNFNIMPVIQVPGPGFGIRLGYMGKAGFSLQYVMTRGRKILKPDVTYDPGINGLKGTHLISPSGS